jgi:hypothetical protein
MLRLGVPIAGLVIAGFGMNRMPNRLDVDDMHRRTRHILLGSELRLSPYSVEMPDKLTLTPTNISLENSDTTLLVAIWETPRFILLPHQGFSRFGMGLIRDRPFGLSSYQEQHHFYLGVDDAGVPSSSWVPYDGVDHE